MGNKYLDAFHARKGTAPVTAPKVAKPPVPKPAVPSTPAPVVVVQSRVHTADVSEQILENVDDKFDHVEIAVDFDEETTKDEDDAKDEDTEESEEEELTEDELEKLTAPGATTPPVETGKKKKRRRKKNRAE